MFAGLYNPCRLRWALILIYRRSFVRFFLFLSFFSRRSLGTLFPCVLWFDCFYVISCTRSIISDNVFSSQGKKVRKQLMKNAQKQSVHDKHRGDEKKELFYLKNDAVFGNIS